jgi:hypothetical protein
MRAGLRPEQLDGDELEYYTVAGQVADGSRAQLVQPITKRMDGDVAALAEFGLGQPGAAKVGDHA